MIFNFLRKQVSVHYNEVADASAHNEEVEDLVASEVFMFVIENRYFQCINNTADCVDIIPPASSHPKAAKGILRKICANARTHVHPIPI